MNYIELSKERYSCRKFSEKPVEKELIMQIIECGLAAPSHCKKRAKSEIVIHLSS